MTSGVIYECHCIPSDKSYIGMTTQPLDKYWEKRFRNILNAPLNRNFTLIEKAIRKYEADAFRVTKICNFSNHEEGCKLEIFWIKELNTLAPNGYNLTLGGEGTPGWVPSDEWCKKVRERLLGNQHTKGHKHSEESHDR